jgi:hypothetical protein
VYYEMLTMNQPFGNMTQKEHLRKVAGPKGGQRPGVYQFDLTPSMISLLQRAWDQNPQKRPTMESVGRNLQLILQELEVMIKSEQRALLKEAGGTEEAVAALTFREERAIRRAKIKNEWDRQAKNARTMRGRQTSLTSSLMQTMRSKADGLFATNEYRRRDVREGIMAAPPDGKLGQPSRKPIPGHENPSSSPPRDLGDSLESKAEVDLDALEYEAWSSDGDDDGQDSSSLESEDPSSLTDHFGETGGERDVEPAETTEVDTSVVVEGDEKTGVVGESISAPTSKRKDPKTPPSRNRNFSNLSGDGSKPGSRLRRKTKGGSMKHKTRRLLDGFSFARRGTNRMSRRTMRLSRASVWMMRRDVRLVLLVFSIVTTIAFCSASWIWYKKRQRTWLGVDLQYLGEHNKSNAEEILEAAIFEACRLGQLLDQNPDVPLLFQGGALSPVDQGCFDSLHRHLDEKLATAIGTGTKKANDSFIGFLNILQFERPPPQPRKSRWRRKKAWKFFRQPEPSETTTDSDWSSNKGLQQFCVKTKTRESYPTLSETQLVGLETIKFRLKSAWAFFGQSEFRNVAAEPETLPAGREASCDAKDNVETESVQLVDVGV